MKEESCDLAITLYEAIAYMYSILNTEDIVDALFRILAASATTPCCRQCIE